MKDRSIRRFMESSAFRLPKWLEAAGEILAEQRGIDDDDEGEVPRPKLSRQTVSLARAHPAAVASVLAIVVCGIAFRDMFGPGAVRGAVVAAFPSGPSALFGEFVSGFRTTGLGGAGAGSPALAALGGLSTLLLGSTGLAQKVVLGGLPVVAGVTMYRSLTRQTGDGLAAAVAAASYALSGIVMWAFSDGRVDVLVALAALPALADRLESAFDAEAPAQRRRFVVGLGVALAVGVSFFPGIAPAFLVLVAVRVLAAPARLRGIGLTAGGVVVGALLVLPFLPSLAAADAAALGSSVGTLDVHRIGRLGLGPGPGTGPIAWFLPIAAVFALSLASGEVRGRALRATLTAVAGLALAWLSAAGYLPEALSNQVAYVSLVAASEALLVGYGVASLAGGVGSESFGWRQIGAAGLIAVLAAGLSLQAILAMVGGWSWGGSEAIPPAWAVIADRTEGEFRVLWIGDDVGMAFPAPGGDAQGIVDAGADSVRFNVTDRNGITILDTGRSLTGPGTGYLRAVLERMLAGGTRHAGALLGPLGVRYVVAREGDLPAGARAALGTQLDLDPIPSEGLVIYRNAHALPPAAVSTDPITAQIAAGSSLDQIQRLADPGAAAASRVPGGWDASGADGAAVLIGSERVSGFRAHDAERIVGAGRDLVRVGDPHRDLRRRGPRPRRGSVGSNPLGLGARPALGGRAVDHAQAGVVAMRSRGRLGLAVLTVVAVVAAGVALDRAEPAARPGPADVVATSGAWFCPHGGGPEWQTDLYVANPGHDGVRDPRDVAHGQAQRRGSDLHGRSGHRDPGAGGLDRPGLVVVRGVLRRMGGRGVGHARGWVRNGRGGRAVRPRGRHALVRGGRNHRAGAGCRPHRDEPVRRRRGDRRRGALAVARPDPELEPHRSAHRAASQRDAAAEHGLRRRAGGGRRGPRADRTRRRVLTGDLLGRGDPQRARRAVADQ